jgi:hypothetical protein
MPDLIFLAYRRLILKFCFVYGFAPGTGMKSLGLGAESTGFIEAAAVNG